MNLLLLEPGELGAGPEVTLRDDRARHLRDVLRVVPGQPVRAGVIDGPLGTVTVVEVHPDRVGIDVSGLAGAAVPDRPRVDLLLAMPRPKVFARLLASIAAVGVGRVWISDAARVERYYFDCHQLRPDEIRRHLLDGLEQARDTRVPELSVHRGLDRLVQAELPDAATRLVADLAPGLPRVAEACPPGGRVVVAVGPEGGWVPRERRLLSEHGFVAVSLGERVLTADVACVVALGLVHDALRR
ncbi:MAG: 16S rRNA (uracil(1498)-N(3))-methyltransferase [Polyangiaceae bacterium]|nr:16S rRNA (uracil(1498)-N(3))-methyltransferase [Polyangiaceae bacterium]